LKIFDKWVLRRIFRPQKQQVVGGWKRLHNEELRNLYASPNIIRVLKSRNMMWVRHVARMGKMRNAYNILVGRRRRKIPLGRPRRRWDYDIRMDLSSPSFQVLRPVCHFPTILGLYKAGVAQSI
jgi:hypothetical protein